MNMGWGMLDTQGAPRDLKEEVQYLRQCLKQSREALHAMEVIEEWQDAPTEIQRIYKNVQDSIAALDLYLYTLEQKY